MKLNICEFNELCKAVNDAALQYVVNQSPHNVALFCETERNTIFHQYSHYEYLVDGCQSVGPDTEFCTPSITRYEVLCKGDQSLQSAIDSLPHIISEAINYLQGTVHPKEIGSVRTLLEYKPVDNAYDLEMQYAMFIPPVDESNQLSRACKHPYQPV